LPENRGFVEEVLSGYVACGSGHGLPMFDALRGRPAQVNRGNPLRPAHIWLRLRELLRRCNPHCGAYGMSVRVSRVDLSSIGHWDLRCARRAQGKLPLLAITSISRFRGLSASPRSARIIAGRGNKPEREAGDA
jgi:hypothetical protein